MIALSQPLGRINPVIHGSATSDPWRLTDHLAELERLVGQALTTSVHPLGDDLSGYLADRAKGVFDLCQIAAGRLPGATALAQRVRHHALAMTVAPGEPVPLNLFALCAFIAAGERTSLPPLSRSAKILEWYLSSFLVDQPAEIAPADFATLRAAQQPRSELAPALAGIELITPPAQPISRSGHKTGNVLRSGQHALLINQGSGSRYFLAGDWNGPEPDHTWSRPCSAMLAFDLIEPIGEHCLLEIDLMLPHLPAGSPEQCTITLNSVPLTTLKRHGKRSLRMLLPGWSFLAGANYLGFHAPDFTPSRYGSADQRQLGVALSRFRICLDA